MARSVESALVVIPPENKWGLVQEIRRQHDKAYDRWMPHINLLFPFVPLEDFERNRQELEKRARDVGPFSLTFEGLGHFAKGKGAILWAKPVTKPAGALELLYQRLIEVFPQCVRDDGEFQPHMTLGQFPNERALKAMQERENDIVEDFTFQVDKLQFIMRDGKTPFRVIADVCLGEPTAATAASPRISKDPVDINRLRSTEFCLETVTQHLVAWLRRNPPANHPKTREALLNHLRKTAHIRAVADPKRILADLAAAGYVTRSQSKSRRGAATAISGGRGRGRGRGRGMPAAPSADPSPPRTVTLAAPRSAEQEIGGTPDAVLHAIQPQTYGDVLRKAKAWVLRVRATVMGRQPQPQTKFLKALAQVCTVAVPVDPDAILEHLQVESLVRITSDGQICFNVTR